MKHFVHRNVLARRFLQLAFVLCLASLLLGLLAVWGQKRAVAGSAWHNPADTMRVERIPSDLAALSLAGIPDQEVLALAMEMAELEATHALLVCSGDLTDKQRVSAWMWLADHYHQGGKAREAAQAYRLAGSGAVLSDRLPDLLRIETVVAVGQQLLDLHDQVSARYFLQQAVILGAYAPHLTAHHRQTLLTRLVPALLKAGGSRKDWSELAGAVATDQALGGSVSPNRPDEAPIWRESPPEDAAVVEARDARRAAAAAWLATETRGYSADPSRVLSDTATGPPQGDAMTPEQVREALRLALLAEDGAVVQYVTREEATGSPSLAAQETLLRWLLVKRCIAWGGVGARLVPEWESQREEIDAALADAWQNWLAVQASAPGGEWAIGDGRLPARTARLAIIRAYWGLFPEAPIVDLLSVVKPSVDFGRLQLTILEPGTPPVLGWSRN